MTDGRLGVAHRRARRDQLIDLGVDRGRHRGVVVPQDADRDPVRKVQVGLAVRVVQAMALAPCPRTLEVAAEDRGQVVGGEGGEVEAGGSRRGHGVHGWVLGYVAGRAASFGRAAADLPPSISGGSGAPGGPKVAPMARASSGDDVLAVRRGSPVG